MTLTSGDFRVYMRQLAGWVWKEQSAAHQFGLSLQEETITEVLLLEMARKLSPLGLSVRMFSKAQEGGRVRKTKGVAPGGVEAEAEEVVIEAEGADWEWFFEGPGGCMASFRVQAKKLYKDNPIKDGRYGGFKPGDRQIQDLIDRAMGSNPIYVLYNHPDVRNSSLFGPSRQPDFFGRDCWGCAVTTAQFMKHATSEKLDAIKPGMVPWHRFFSIGQPCRPKGAMNEIAKSAALPDGEEAQTFIPAKRRPDWVDMLSEGATGLTDLLVERQLQGVAHIDFSKIREV
ncbi:hypothetical protein BMG03_10585 [Thioclava nitratireducens]|uniref:Uncharacterized protein n=1 Tax=Thioclava nitratireducens TaxID=1915078 RepID=A0ABM6IHK4_9RHOB|nr:hypothetical protein [Thioclava nitratireducens]AQS48194.1 hypothetical protein BMG03_10585 [Thioclava nitratireducens]